MSDQSDIVLYSDLVQDALLYSERAFNSLSATAQAGIAAGLETGGSIEVQVRMTPGKPTAIRILMIGPRGEIEVHRTKLVPV